MGGAVDAAEETKIAWVRVIIQTGREGKEPFSDVYKPFFYIIGNSLVKGFGGCSTAGLA